MNKSNNKEMNDSNGPTLHIDCFGLLNCSGR